MKEIKRVLFTVDTIGKSGIVNVVNNIASLLHSDGRYDISILCTGIIEKERVNSNLRIYDLDISKYGHRKKYLFLVQSLKRFFKDHRFDFVVVSGMELVSFYYLSTRNSTMKMIAWEHRNFHAGPKYHLEWLGKRIACKKFDKVICITKKDAKLYKSYCKNQDKIVQIYNVSSDIDPKEYKADSKKIVTVAYLDEYYKGYDLLIEVAKKVFPGNDEFSWDVYGEGKDRDCIQEKIDNSGLHDKVVLRGFVDNIGELYQNYSLFVFTSRNEGMGMVLIEAQKNRLPVIAFDIECGPSDVISDGDNGYLIKPFDVNDMAKKIINLINDKKKRVMFSQKSQMCLKEFDRKYILEEWYNLFDKI